MLIKPDVNTLLPVFCELPASLLPWLTYQHSLTERLTARAGNTHLDVLDQRWESPDWWDKQVLNTKDSTVLHREIVMWASGEPCWYARTIIPQETYIANSELFDRLKKESLGVLIFTESVIKRTSLFHYAIDDKSIEYHWLNKTLSCKATTLWVRMSVFTIHNELNFYLIEIMLPGLMRFPN